MKKSFVILNLIVFILGLVYLLLPSPKYPDLDNAVRSDEPGDTWQNPDQKGFYTNLTRADVLKNLQSKFVLKLGSMIIPSYRLNYRPEETAELVRDQLKSNYLEEIIYPFRESLFVNGFEPQNYPGYAYLPSADKPQISFRGQPYYSKVTLRPVSSPVWARVLVWILVSPAFYLTFYSLKRSLKNDK